MSLLTLPTELLDHIFSYLEWDRTRQLYPVKTDLVNASFTCRRLHTALAPSIFRDVTLRLRWVDGELAEPALLKLRMQSPQLMKHIRGVTISTDAEDCTHCAQKDHCQPFVPPADQQDWLSFKGENQSHLASEFRHRVDTLARTSTTDANLRDSCSDASAESIIGACRAARLRRPKLDCLAIVMLCIPPNTHSIILKSASSGRNHGSKNHFSLRLLATCIEVLADQLQELTLVPIVNYNLAIRQLTDNANVAPEDILLPASILERCKIQRLVLASRENNIFGNYTPTLEHKAFERWKKAPIRELDLRYMRADINEVVQLTKGFPSLETIRIRDCVVFIAARTPNRQELERHVWLQLAIELRRQLPNARIKLSNLFRPGSYDQLTESAVRWIMREAIPKGALIDADREQRLTEDFLSFSFLWEVEEGERGAKALGARRLWASLSDEAMTRRWR